MHQPPNPPLPDLSTPEGRTSYQAELARVARGWRWAGLALVIAGALTFLSQHKGWVEAAHDPVGQAAIAMLVVGWAVVLVGIVKRKRYHARRMRGRG